MTGRRAKTAPAEQKRLTRDFFNTVAGEWFERTYDPRAEYRKYPSNRVRMELALGEIKRLKIRGPFLDVGCGTGELVIELLRRNIPTTGIDIAEKMIALARANVKRALPNADPAKTFRATDLDAFRAPRGSFRNAAALGLLEYLATDDELLRFLARVIPRKGRALVECRNKFFNLASLNTYTSDLAASHEFSKLIDEYGASGEFSRLPYSAIPKVADETTRAASLFLRRAVNDREWRETVTKKFSSYPSLMVRRQHTPQEIQRSAARYGFALRYVVYWHIHPFPPVFEKHFPRIFNKLSVLLGPLGHTPLGASLGSSFLAVLERV
ncbi:MAG: hypothetical protein A3A44_00690 [Candidatus Sungbacteria bacterium RIFCSPLOWO2_01_FULL_60_25]|uniref:Methyltransferase domain-containing protein n=1 Tax=Candidatus Sungbacteria bacterium RIFCSPLOWO2_01_FULL_60_25 TaxID=1802281 RepID=A0A1G2LD24_9BACT|nr:MAG: hypothetical protein A3A44_00690 [Candidatus Sungbacteria bacterium RIFCSPLOWO2_01_FULL_60_25]